MKHIIVLLVFISLPTFSEEITDDQIRDMLEGIALVCDGEPVPESERSLSPRIESKSFTEEESGKVLSLYNENIEAGNTCLIDFVDSYQHTLYEYCEKYNLAGCIAGGCEHRVGYSINTSVLEASLIKCEIKH